MKAACYSIACLALLMSFNQALAAPVHASASFVLCASGQGNGNGNGNVGSNNGNGNSGNNNGNFNRGSNNGNNNDTDNNGNFNNSNNNGNGGTPPRTDRTLVDPGSWLETPRQKPFFRLNPDRLRRLILQFYRASRH